MALVTLLGDPVLESVEVGPDPESVTPGTYVKCKFICWPTIVPVEFTTKTLFTGEDLPGDFFMGDVHDAVDAYLATINAKTSLDWNMPPVANDTTIWNPATNAPYP